MTTKTTDVRVPLDVPRAAKKTYIQNYMEMTHGSGRLMLFAGDQKVEHLNDDFFGPDASPDDATPEHFFRIASKARIGVFATQLGLIANYGMDYKKVPYMVKLNSKTNMIKPSQADPRSPSWFSIQDIVDFKARSGLRILGVGYTVYLGSEFETELLQEAAQVVYQAHRHGLVSVLWIYPRGKAVKDERDPHVIAGATGVAACLGTDFVKVNYPVKKGCESKEVFKEAILAAGRTKVVCAGGGSEDVESFLKTLHDQINVSGAMGNATGRNIHQKPLKEAVGMCNAIFAVTVEGKGVKEALKIYKKG